MYAVKALYTKPINTSLRFYRSFLRSSSLNAKVNDLLKSTHICQSYHRNKSFPFYGPRTPMNWLSLAYMSWQVMHLFRQAGLRGLRTVVREQLFAGHLFADIIRKTFFRRQCCPRRQLFPDSLCARTIIRSPVNVNW